MSDDTKPAVVRVCEDHYGSPSPAIVRTTDGEEWAVDHVATRDAYLRLVNYEAEDCETVSEVVDIPHRRIEGVQHYPLADDQDELLQHDELIPDGGADDLEQRVADLERKMEHVTAHNRRDTAPEGQL